MKKILIYEFGGLGEANIKSAFERMGFCVEEYYHKADNYDFDKKLLGELAPLIERVKPQFVFSINFLPLVSKICNIYHVLYICWIYDSPELHLYSKAIHNDINRIFIFDKIQYQRFKLSNPQNIFYLPLATEPMKINEMKAITNEERRKYQSDITYIGSLYNDKDRIKRYKEIEQLSPYWRGYVEGLVQAQLQVQGYNFISDSLTDVDIEELKKTLKYALLDDYADIHREVISDYFIGDYCSMLDRLRTLKFISRNYSLTMYTDSDTSELNNDENCQIDNRGIADSITMMPQIFHCSKINLNITSKTISSGIPLRVFDVLGCQGFLISNYQSELFEWFTPGKDLVVYEDMDDLNYKIGYYLQHDDERNAIAEHGYKTVCENYTYDKMLTLMLEACGLDKSY